MEFPPILVINLPERKDRWDILEKTLKPTGLRYERIDAIRRSPGWKGCSMSHRKCVAMAKQREWPWVIILEDDCLLRPKWKANIDALLPTLWASRNQWEVFNGGGSTFLAKPTLLSLDPPLFSIKSYGTQFMLIHEGTYNKILRDVGEHLKVDVYYKDHMKAWCTYPHLSTQQESRSDITGKVESHEDRFATTEKSLINAMKKDATHPLQFTVNGVLVVALLLALTMRFRK